jgi:5-methylcytosine-specific restriction enzyme subunit McrC
MSKSKIPIQNIFYLLGCAWDHLEILKEVDLGQTDYKGPADFFARLLITSFETIRKMGLSQGYSSNSEYRSSPKGKFELTESLKTGALQKNFVRCSLDELTVDVPENRIIKATFLTLIKSHELDKELSDKLRQQLNLLSSVTDVGLTARTFRYFPIQNRKRIYNLMINVCELLYHSLLPEENLPGDVKFNSFIHDENLMPKLFEAFVRNFYRIEQTEFPMVGAPSIAWGYNANKK